MRLPQVTPIEDSVVDLLVTAGRLTRLAGASGGDDLPRAVLRALSVPLACKSGSARCR
ncbi:hypothetical protein [Nocardia sp. NBC_01377]|uniref:hypothetical protein n=1 Tax=Nocardia sp. NBC_01377 TaxID=2903595 RepID=UPI003864F2AB